MDDDALTFVLFDKTGGFLRQVTSGNGASADLVPNGISTAQITVDDDDPLAAYAVDGVRCGVRFRGVERMRGRVSSTPGRGPDGTITFHVQSDARKFWEWQGWPVPSAPLTEQTSEYRSYSGPSETVFKSALAENIARLGVPWTVGLDLGRGTSTRADLRFHPLGDKLLDPLTRDRLVVVISYAADGTPHVDVRAASTVAGVITPATGVLDGYTFDRGAPTVTRVVVGGRGEGVDREFVQVIDTALESDWGDLIEGFADARNTEAGADLTIDAADALRDGAPTAGATLDLIETDRLRYGDHFIEGDLVRVAVGPLDVTEQITLVTIDDSPSDGVVVTPKVGAVEPDDTDTLLAQQISRLARGARDQGRR